MKSYSYIDRAPVQGEVDLRDGLDNTLIILSHKIRQKNVDGRQRLRPRPPADLRLCRRAQPGVDQHPGQRGGRGGRPGGRTHAHLPGDGQAVVEIGTTARAFRPKPRSRVFETFFTTKPAGVGNGLGLDIVCRIVVRSARRGRSASPPGRGTPDSPVRLPV